MVIMLTKEDVEVHPHAVQTMTELNSSICVNGNIVILENFIVVWK
jgi:hypothetical protein